MTRWSATPRRRRCSNVSRIRYWLSVGAQPSEKVQVLLNKHGVKKPAPGEPWQLPETPAATATSTAGADHGPGPGSGARPRWKPRRPRELVNPARRCRRRRSASTC